jgi:endonuclease III
MAIKEDIMFYHRQVAQVRSITRPAKKHTLRLMDGNLSLSESELEFLREVMGRAGQLFLEPLNMNLSTLEEMLVRDAAEASAIFEHGKGTPFRFMIATRLSARCRDLMVTK